MVTMIRSVYLGSLGVDIMIYRNVVVRLFSDIWFGFFLVFASQNSRLLYLESRGAFASPTPVWSSKAVRCECPTCCDGALQVQV